MKRFSKIAGAVGSCALALSLMAPMAALAAPSGAASVDPFASRTLKEAQWTVTFTGSAMTSDEDLRQMVQGLQPGDGAEFHITLVNDCSQEVDWWVRNAIQDSMEGQNSLEEGGTNTGGAYTYELVYHDPDEAEPVLLYTNANVGGDDATAGASSDPARARAATQEEGSGSGGLFNATQDSGMEDYFHLDTFRPYETRSMVLRMAIDGETHTNNYFDTDAGALIQYAAEPVASDTITYLQEPDRYNYQVEGDPLPQTGDLLPTLTILCLLLGCLLLAVGAASYLNDLKGKKEARS